MYWLNWVIAGGLSLATLACGDDGSGSDSNDDGSTTSTTVDETTLPITISSTAADTTVSASGTSTTTEATTDDSTTTADPTGTSDPSDTATATATDTATTTGGDPLVVMWCILQFPPAIPTPPDNSPVGAGDPTPAYSRFYVPTVTDQTEFNDADPRVMVEFGYGDDGSDPAVDDWTWAAGSPNPGWDGSMAMGGFGNENNDEYLGDITFDAAGTYDFASRVSGDGGSTWVYCDLDGLEVGGYTPDQAGDATITQ